MQSCQGGMADGYEKESRPRRYRLGLLDCLLPQWIVS